MTILSRPFDGISLVDLAVRLLLAMFCGAMIGIGRSVRDRNAGLRTYMLVCVGSAAATMISLYDYEMLRTAWQGVFVGAGGNKFDASRIASLAVTGIGFCGAGLIVKISNHRVQGLTTATGLFTTVCLGIATGLGFYECVIPGLILVMLVLNELSPLEGAFKRRIKNMTMNVTFANLADLSDIVEKLESIDVVIQDVDLDPADASGSKRASAVFVLKLPRFNFSHTSVLTAVAEMPCVYSVQEVVA